MARPIGALLGHPAPASGAARATTPDRLAQENESAHHDRETPRRDPQSVQTACSPITTDCAVRQPVVPIAYPPSEFRRRADTRSLLGTCATDPLPGLPDSRPHSDSARARDESALLPWRREPPQADSR